MSVTTKSASTQPNIPLPSTTPPPVPSASSLSPSTGSHVAGIPAYPPPSLVATNVQQSAAAYQQYYQYYQYMYYANPAAAAMMQGYPMANSAAGQAAVAAAMQGYYNYNQPPTAAQKPATVTPSPAQPRQQAQPQVQPKPNQTEISNEQPKQPQIKINLKFQQQQTSSKQETDTVASQSNTNLADNVDVKPPPRKSRFSTADSISNVVDEQNKFSSQKSEDKQKIETNQPKEEENETKKISDESTKSNDPVSDIVFDINKWPVALKTYCAKVYQHYQQITLVSEDQVTKYLQKRITDAFKLKPDLNIGWENESLPDITSIKKVAPFSQQQLQQQQRQQQQQLALQQKKQQIQQNKLKQETLATAQAIKQGQKNVVASNKFNQKPNNKHLPQTTLMSSIKENVLDQKKRKNRSSSSRSASSSRSRSSSSSRSSAKSRKTTSSSNSSSDENFISLNHKNGYNNKKASFGNNYKNNLKRKMSDLGDDVDGDSRILDEDKLNENSNINFNKLSRKQRRKLMIQQRKQQQKQQQQQSKPFNNYNTNNFVISRKFDSSSSLTNIRKNMRNIFELAKEEMDDMEKEEIHSKNICIGLCQDLEKEYLRLTSQPEPSVVRPLEVLKRSLDYVLLKYSRTNDYRYIWEQLKAIRQDLTVQQIRNEFTIQVYEAHARIAIKNKDRDEFNQCQNQLKSLYTLEFLKSQAGDDFEDNSAEFVGYRLLYNMLTKSYKDIDQVIKEIKQKYSTNKNLKHLLELNQAWYLNNYIKFFKLYKKSDQLCKCLIDLFIERERKQALKAIIKSYRPSIKLDVVSEMLAYESSDKCKTDLTEYKLIIIEDVTSLNPINNHKSSKSTTSELYIDCKTCNLQSF